MTDHTTSDTTTAPVPPKWKLPVWAWIVSVIVLVLLAIPVIAVIAGHNSESSDESAANEPGAVASATPTAPSASTAPSESAEPPATPRPSDEGAASGQSTGNVSLDDFFIVGQTQPAIWQLPFVDGWEITTIDQEGVSVQTNAALDCTFTTVQNRLTSDIADATSDRADTEGVVQNLQQGFITQFTDAEITNTPGLAVPYGSTGIVEGDVEFAGFRADYVRADTGEEFSSMIVVRAMSQIDGAMYSVLNCPTETINADETIWRGMLDQNVVVAGD